MSNNPQTVLTRTIHVHDQLVGISCTQVRPQPPDLADVTYPMRRLVRQPQRAVISQSALTCPPLNLTLPPIVNTLRVNERLVLADLHSYLCPIMPDTIDAPPHLNPPVIFDAMLHLL